MYINPVRMEILKGVARLFVVGRIMSLLFLSTGELCMAGTFTIPPFRAKSNAMGITVP